MKKVVAATLAATLSVLTLSGCGSDSSTVQGSAEGEAIRLEFYQQKSEVIELYDDLIARFNEQNPDIVIEQVAVPDAETALRTRCSTNDVPDIITTYPMSQMYQDMMRAGLLMDLSGEEVLNRVTEESLELAQCDGKDYAIPTVMSAYGLYYNKDIFAANGIEMPEDLTYDQFLDILQKLKDAGVQPIVFRDKDAGGVRQEADRVSGIINNDITQVFERVAKGETSLTKEPEIRMMAENMLKIREYGQTDTMGTGEEQAVSDFINGKAAMFINGSWFVTEVLKDNADLNVEMVPYPNPAGGTSKIPVSIDLAYSISASLNEQEKEAALRFIDFMTSPEIAQEFADREGSPTTVVDVTCKAPQLKRVSEMIANGEYFACPSNLVPAGMFEAWQPYLQELIIQKDIDSFLTQTDSLFTEYYNK